MTTTDGLSAIAHGIRDVKARTCCEPARMEIAKDLHADILSSVQLFRPAQPGSTIMGIEFRVSPVVPDGWVMFLDRAGNVVGTIDTNAKPDA